MLSEARFDKPTDAVDFAERNIPANDENARIVRNVRSNRKAWFGGSMADVRDSLTNPPEFLMRAVDEARSEIERSVEPPERRRRKLRRNLEDGDEMDERGWLERRTDPWQETRKTSRTSSVVRIAVNTAVSVQMVQSQLTWRGAAAVALADVLEARGVSAEIVTYGYAEDVTPHLSESSLVETVVKRAGDPLDVGLAAVCCSTLSWHRRVVMSCRALAAEGAVCESLGYSAMLPQTEASAYDYVIDCNVMNLSDAVRIVAPIANIEHARA